MQTYQVPVNHIGSMIARLEKIERKCNKYGNKPVIWNVSKEPHEVTRFRTIRCDGEVFEKKVTVLVHDVTISGEAPKVNGWTVLAKKEIEKNDAAFINMFPCFHDDKEALEAVLPYRNEEDHCDHCKTNKRRKYLFIVRNDKGETRQIGHTCVRDYLGTDDPSWIVSSFQHLKEIRMDLEEYDTPLRGLSGVDSIDDILAYSAAVIKVKGWVSTRMSNDSFNESDYPKTATFSHVAKMLSHQVVEDVKVTKDDYRIADEVKEWVRSSENESDYFLNLQAAMKDDYLYNTKRRSLVVSAVASYFRYIEKLYQASEEDLEKWTSKHVGEVDDRLKDIPVLVTMVKFLGQGPYGDKYLNKFRDDEGNIYVTFTSRCFEQDKRFLLDGTVKKHNNYKGRNETLLMRVSLHDAPMLL